MRIISFEAIQFQGKTPFLLFKTTELSAGANDKNTSKLQFSQIDLPEFHIQALIHNILTSFIFQISI